MANSDEWEVLVLSKDSYAPVSVYNIMQCHLENKGIHNALCNALLLQEDPLQIESPLSFEDEHSNVKLIREECVTICEDEKKAIADMITYINKEKASVRCSVNGRTGLGMLSFQCDEAASNNMSVEMEVQMVMDNIKGKHQRSHI